MIVTITLNGKKVIEDISADMTLYGVCQRTWVLQCKVADAKPQTVVSAPYF